MVGVVYGCKRNALYEGATFFAFAEMRVLCMGMDAVLKTLLQLFQNPMLFKNQYYLYETAIKSHLFFSVKGIMMIFTPVTKLILLTTL